jgi:hypothetical protein
MSRFPYFLDNWLIYGDEIVSLKRRPRFTMRKNYACSLLEACKGAVLFIL